MKWILVALLGTLCVLREIGESARSRNDDVDLRDRQPKSKDEETTRSDDDGKRRNDRSPRNFRDSAEDTENREIRQNENRERCSSRPTVVHYHYHYDGCCDRENYEKGRREGGDYERRNEHRKDVDGDTQQEKWKNEDRKTKGRRDKHHVDSEERENPKKDGHTDEPDRDREKEDKGGRHRSDREDSEKEDRRGRPRSDREETEDRRRPPSTTAKPPRTAEFPPIPPIELGGGAVHYFEQK